ncbi:MAG: DUF4197 domain-containing protein [Bacteroidales bacterium]
MKRQILAYMVLFIVLTGCDQLKQIAEELDTPRPLTEQEVVRGLKQALTIGADSAASGLASRDGYFLDNAVRINLPPEARVITENISYLPGGEALVEDIVLRINRAAEDAAREAAPVFARAVSRMTIRDGFSILRGDDDAATQYLKTNTYQELYQLYQPKIRASTDKPIVGNISTMEAWNTLTGRWNNIANTTAGRLAGLKSVDVALDKHLTERALDGVFLKLAEEEKKIRHDPVARVTELLRRVFG